MLSDSSLDRGNLNNATGLDFTKKLNAYNGQYVSLYVENHGTNAVVATINGGNETTLAPGESGHIFVEVTQNFLGQDRDYRFQVVSGPNGGSANISYQIAQGDAQ